MYYLGRRHESFHATSHDATYVYVFVRQCIPEYHGLAVARAGVRLAYTEAFAGYPRRVLRTT